ncbi:MAG: ABC transporter ATP-binding protein [Geminicoccaceae bacterium]
MSDSATAGPKLRLDAVRKTFTVPRSSATVVAVETADLAIEAGEFLTIVGPSGCGKSTILNMLAGLELPSAGTVAMDGRPITGPAAERGMVFQDYALFPWKTVFENVEFGLRYGPHGKGLGTAERRRRVARCVELVGLGGSEQKYPHELSGGMRQRCGIARLVANEPDVLLMDEPFAALDAQTRIILQEELLRIWGETRPRAERRTVVFITHAIDEAVFLSDRVVVMSAHPGRIIETLDVDLPRPRTDATRTRPDFQALSQTIWNLIRDEVYRAATAAGTAGGAAD